MGTQCNCKCSYKLLSKNYKFFYYNLFIYIEILWQLVEL